MREDTDRRQDEQIEKLWDAVAEIRLDKSKLWTAVEKLKVVVSGEDGKNGINSRVRDLEDGRDDMEMRLASGYKDCPLGEAIEKHLEWHEKGTGAALTTRRFFIAQAITVIIFLAGILLTRVGL